MKSFTPILLLILFIFGCNADTNGPGFTYHTKYDELRDVFFTDTLNGWAVGAFNDINNGYRTYGRVIIHTTDNGAIWTSQVPAQTMNGGLYTIWFADVNTGWAAGDSGRIIKTINGGYIWTDNTPVTGARINCLYFIDSFNGWAASDSGIVLQTKDGGSTWSVIYRNPGRNFTGIRFVNQQTGWLCGYTGDSVSTTGLVGKTNDGGITWSFPTLPLPQKALNRIFFVGRDSGWAVGPNYIVNTTDGGSSWNLQWNATKGPQLAYLEAVYFRNSLEGFAGGAYNDYVSRILRTDDGGKNWYVIAQNLEMPLEVHGMFFADYNQGWVVGGLKGTIYQTKNGGVNWFRVY